MRGKAPAAARAALALCIGCSVACGTGPIDALGLAPSGREAGLVAHWTFDEGAGTVVHDSSGNGHDGTLTGPATAWSSGGKFGQGLHLDQGDYMAVEGFPDATPGWTVSAWVFFPSSSIGIGEATVISSELVFHGGWEMNLTALSTDLRYHFGFWTGPGTYDYLGHFECMGCLEPDRWQHVIAVVDAAAGTLAFYLDHELKGRTSIPRAIRPGSSTLYVGAWSGSWTMHDQQRFLVGAVDDISIWSRPLVSAEVALLTQAPAPSCTQPGCAGVLDAGR